MPFLRHDDMYTRYSKSFIGLNDVHTHYSKSFLGLNDVHTHYSKSFLGLNDTLAIFLSFLGHYNCQQFFSLSIKSCLHVAIGVST
jgi:hypothetical protein